MPKYHKKFGNLCTRILLKPHLRNTATIVSFLYFTFSLNNNYNLKKINL